MGNEKLLPFSESPTALNTIESASIIRALDAQALGYTGKGVKVAVVDTGVQSDHPAIVGHVIKKIKLASGNIEDGCGHGTHVASILLSVAPEVEIINVKVLDDEGGGNLDDVMKGIEIAVSEGASVISMSLGLYIGCYENHPICLLINQLNRDKKIMFAIAAGNGGPYTNPATPALAKQAVAVAATDQYDNVADFSSRGPACGRIFPDCAAPGVGINAAFPVNDWKSLSGTSMATPSVAGMLAILRQKFGRGLLKEEIEAILQSSSMALESGKNDDSGWGRIDVMNALEIAPTISVPQPSNLLPLLFIGLVGAGIYYFDRLRKK